MNFNEFLTSGRRLYWDGHGWIPFTDHKPTRVKVADMPNPLDRQVGGSHYKEMAIQPIELIMANNLSFPVGNIVKYACRFDKKGQAKEDLEKVIHYA